MPYACKQSRISRTPYPHLGGQAPTGAQNSDPSPQILVGTRNNFVIDLARKPKKVARPWSRTSRERLAMQVLLAIPRESG